MHAGTITWNGLDLSLLGKPKLGISRQADPPAPAFPTRQLVTLKVTVDLESSDPGTIQARVEHLQQSMMVAEGILQSSVGSGHALAWLAVPGSTNLARVLDGTTNTLELGFSAVEPHGTAAIDGISSAVFTPAGSASPITLLAIRDLKDDISPERHSQLASARKRTNHTMGFTSRYAQSNPADSMPVRMAYLLAKAQEVKALDCREGRLVVGSLDRIVRVTDLSPVIDEARGVVDVRVQAFYTVLPDVGKAEAAIDIKDRVEAGSGERVLTFSGTIEAETRDIALAKVEAIRQARSTDGRRTVSFETGDRAIDGADTEGVAGADWSGALTFSLEMREARAGAHYSLKVTTAKETRSGMRRSYSGSVTAASEGAALAIARGLAAAESLVRTKSDETIESTSNIWIVAEGAQPAPDFVKLDFSYEYEGPSDGFIGGEIMTDRALPLFGEHRRSISGNLVAATREIAEGRMEALLAGEGTALEKGIKWSEIYLDESGTDDPVKRTFQKLDFTATARATRTQAAAKFTDTTSSDLTTMQQRREVAGSIFTDTEVHAETVLEELITALFGDTPPTTIVKTHQRERWGNATQTATTASNSAWAAQLDFQLSLSSKLTGEIGYDIIEASFTLERVGSLNNTVVTAIPYDRPVAQTGTGYLPGRVSISATCKARVQATAMSWVQGKRSLVSGIGTAGVTRHETEQPRESSTPEHAPFSGSDVTTWSASASYGWTFTGTVLDGLWGSGFAGI